MLLYGKPIAQEMKTDLKNQVQMLFGGEKKYVAILFFGDNKSSAVYVKHKQKFGSEIGLSTFVFGQGNQEIVDQDSSLLPYLQQEKRDKNQILDLIHLLNHDPDCVGIIIQLPLPENLQEYKNEFLSAIAPEKDIDGLGACLVGKSFFEMLEFSPATPKAVISLLEYYHLDDFRGKKVAIIGQSTIVGKPLALEVLKRGGILGCFDIRNSQEEIKAFCQQADYIFSGTGQVHLIDDSYLNGKKDQILIDIGYGHIDGKAVGDVNYELVKDKVLHITPVPGGIGPLTIASLFSNVIVLWKQFH